MTHRWFPFLFWSAVLLFASGAQFSAGNTGGLLASITSHLGLDLSAAQLAQLDFVLRKLGHLTAYGIEGALAFRAVGLKRRRVVHALALTLLVAAVDEAQQSAIPSRTGSPVDVAIDGVGAVVAIAISARRVASGKPT